MCAQWTDNAKRILEKQYLRKDEEGNIAETPDGLLLRVARTVSQNDVAYYDDFLEILDNLEFLPNSPTLMNAGTRLGQLSGCFVLPIEDNISAIFEAVKQSALIHKSGGGCFKKGTRVKVDYWESKVIEDFASGDKILTYNPDEDRFEEGEVVAVFQPDVSKKRKVKLKFEGFEITTTEDHPFGIMKDGIFSFVNAIDLTSDMDIIDFSNYCPICGRIKEFLHKKTCSIECSYKFRALDKTHKYGEGYHREISRKMKSSPMATCPSEVRHWTMRGYSDEEAERIISDIQKGNSPMSVQYYLNKGSSIEDAVSQQKEHQRSVSKRCSEYWLSRGYSDEEALVKIGESQARGFPFFLDKYGEDAEQVYSDYIVNKITTLPEFWLRRGYSEPDAIAKAIEQSEIRHKGVPVEFELVVSNELDKFGIPFEHQKAFNCVGNRFEFLHDKMYICVDFYFPSLNLVVEADAYKDPYTQSQRDTFLLEEYGLKVFRIRKWNFEEDLSALGMEVCDEIVV